MRRENSIRNISYSILGQMISNLLGFISRTIFISTIGIIYLGINGLFVVILGLLSLANLGLDSAISFSLYEPITKGDTNKITILMRLYAKAYKIIAVTIFIIGIALIPFLPYIIKEMPDIPYVRVYYLLQLVSTVSSYFFVYKRTLIICDQKEYINTKNSNFFIVLQYSIQILILIVAKNYALYLITAVVCTILCNISISIKVDQAYPYIKEKSIGKLDEKTKKQITKNVIAMVFNKISDTIVYSSDNLIISTFLGLKMVGIYSNYYLLLQLINKFLEQIFSAITASVANLSVKGSTEDKQNAYHNIYFINFWMVSVCTTCFYFLLDSFITLWIGETFLLNRGTTIVLVIWFYNQSMRYTVRVFKNTAGLYWNDRYRPIVEAVINLVSSITLLKVFGIAGVFLGTVISLMTTSFWIEPYVVYKHILKEKFFRFFITYGFYLGICVLQITLIKMISLSFSGITVLNFIGTLFLCLIIPNLLLFLLFRKAEKFQYALLYAKPIYDNITKLKLKFRKINSKEEENDVCFEESYLVMDNNIRRKKYIGIVVVTYNNLQKLKQTIDHIRRQSFPHYAVFIIDNGSTDGTGEYIRGFVKKSHEYLYYKLKTNIGSSGGVYYGVKAAFQNGADYIWCLEDDTFPHKYSLEELMRTMRTMRTREVKTCLLSRSVSDFEKKNLSELRKKENSLIQINNFPFVGVFLPRQLIHDIGYPRKDLIHYFDDIDYSLRAKQAGYKTYQVRDSMLQYQEPIIEEKVVNLLGKSYNLSSRTKSKWYYYMRNGILVYPKEISENKIFRKNHLRLIILVSRAYPDCLLAALKGYVDGKKGVTGKSRKY